MNIIQQQELLKDLSDAQIQREMQQPSGSMPLFLVASEAKRRADLRERFKAEASGPPEQTTVAQDLVQQMSGMGQQAPQQMPQQAPQQPQMPQMPVTQPQLPQQAGLGAAQPRGFAHGGAVKSRSHKGQVRGYNRGGGMFSENAYNDHKYEDIWFHSYPIKSVRTRKSPVDRDKPLTGRDRSRAWQSFGLGPAGDQLKYDRTNIDSSRATHNTNYPGDAVHTLGKQYFLPEDYGWPSGKKDFSLSKTLPQTPVTGTPYRGAHDQAHNFPAQQGPVTATKTAPARTMPAQSPTAVLGTRAGLGSGLPGKYDFQTPEYQAYQNNVDPDALYKKRLETLRAGADPYAAEQAALAKRREDIAKAKDENLNLALIRAGLGMMAGTSPFAGVNIGQGAQAGLNQYIQGNKDIAAREERADSAALQLKRLGLEVDQQRKADAKMYVDGQISKQDLANKIIERENAAKFEETKIINRGIEKGADAANQMAMTMFREAGANARNAASIGAQMKAAEIRASASIASKKGTTTEDLMKRINKNLEKSDTEINEDESGKFTLKDGSTPNHPARELYKIKQLIKLEGIDPEFAAFVVRNRGLRARGVKQPASQNMGMPK